MHATLEDLARAKGVHATYVSRVLRLTLLAPEIVEAILDGRQPGSCSWMICWRGFRWRGRGNDQLCISSGRKNPGLYHGVPGRGRSSFSAQL